MSRQANWPPTVTQHKSGQARVSYRGKTYYLGEYGTPAARSAYARLLVELATGAPTESPAGRTVADLVKQYLAWLAGEPDTSTKRKLRNVAMAMERLLGDVAVDRFSVRHLETLRTAWLSGVGCSQQGNGVANTNTNRVREIVRWAEMREIVPAGMYARLLALPALKGGKGQAVEPVSWERLQATLPHLEPVAASACLLMWWSGMRPKEVVSLRAESIDLAAGTITLTSHKTSKKTGVHVLPIGPEARKILSVLVSTRPAGYLFPSSRGAGHYQPISLARAVHRACVRHSIPHWHPYQLRHAAKERIAQAHGVEAARVILRHTSLGMTARYASRVDLDFAAEIAAKCG